MEHVPPDLHTFPLARREAAPSSRREARALRERAARARTGESVLPPITQPQFLPPPTPGTALMRPPCPPPSTVPPRPMTRSAARASGLVARPEPPQHVRGSRLARIGVGFGLAASAALVLATAVAVTSAVVGPVDDEPRQLVAAASEARPSASATIEVPLPAPAETIPAPSIAAAPAAVDICALPELTAALAAGDDAAAIAAAGGADRFRNAVASGLAPCIALDDPNRVWVVVNKARPLAPVEHEPASVTRVQSTRVAGGAGVLRTDAAAALDAMSTAAADAGAGEIGILSGYRSYGTQVSTYAGHVANSGQAEADLSSARPGHSEHQSGLATDVVACDGGCGSLDDLAWTAQGEWIVAHAWEYGFIVRYEEGHTPVTGYMAEPWHLRYVGTDLARAYHDGGFHTLEEFFGLPAAPNYLG